MRSQQKSYTFIRNSIQRMPENISDEKVDVICLFTDKGRLEARPSLNNEYKEVTHHLQQVVELFLYKTDIHLVVVDNYKLRAGGV